MAPIYFMGIEISKIYKGNVIIDKLYKGDTEISDGEIAPIIYYTFANDSINIGTLGATYDGVDTDMVYNGSEAVFDGATSFIASQDIDLQNYTFEFEFKTSASYSDFGSVYDRAYIIGGNTTGSTNPTQFALGITNNNEIFIYTYATEIISSAVLNDGLFHKVKIIRNDYTNRIQLYIDDVLDNEHLDGTLSENTRIAPFEIGKSRDDNYFTGSIKELKIWDYPTVQDGIRWCTFGDSIAKGDDADFYYGYANIFYENNQELYPANIAIEGTNTSFWLDENNFQTVIDQDAENYLIGLSLVNEGDNDTIFKTRITELVADTLALGGNVYLTSNLPRDDGDYQKRMDVDKWEEETLGIPIFNIMGALDDTTGQFITSYNQDGGGVHPNNDGHLKGCYGSMSSYILKSGTFDWSLVPDSLTNSTKSFYKPDALTQNAIELTTQDVIHHWNLEFDIKSDSDLTGKNLFSTSQDGISFRCFVDVDNAIKISDGITTISTGITTTTIDDWKRITLRFNRALSLRVYVDGVYVSEIDYVGSEINNTTAVKIILGGLYNDNSNDAVDVYFRNLVLHRGLNNEDRIAESGVSGYIVKASQEYYNQCENLGDLSNDSQTDTAMIVNDGNITVVTE